MKIPFIGLLFLLANLFLFRVAMSIDTNSDEGNMKHGLVGILYDDINLGRPVSLWYLEKLDSKQLEWEKRNDFSAKWQGVIKSPITGILTFFGEADNGMIMQIDGKIVLNGWENGRNVHGSIDVIEGNFYIVNLSYRQSNGSSYMKIYWQWENHPKSIVPEEAIWFSENDEVYIQEKFNEALDIPLDELEFDIRSIIHIKTDNDISKKREELREFIFGRKDFPGEKLPDFTFENFTDPDFEGLGNLDRIDKLEMSLEWELNSIAYHFVPKNSINMAIIYHQGHRGKFLEGKSTIQAFLLKGFDVIALSMPLKGYNRKPIVSFPQFGKMMIVTHEQMSFLIPTSGHPVRYFLDPVIIVVNYLIYHHFDQIMMIGISGGGWTTTLCAAIDARILKSFPVAGSLPFYLRSRDINNQSTFGDYEQYIPELYRIANYLDLYIMGAYGDGRKQMQILNQYDSCCFEGTGYTTYVDLIKSRMNELVKGEFDVYLDSSHREHKISKVALSVIFEDIFK
jgi:hypothetical protein